MVTGQFFLILLTNQLAIERSFEYNGGMGLGDHDTAIDAALDALNEALDNLITAVETGGLDHLTAVDKVAVWQRFETLRNQLPLVDHHLIADAESNDLPGEYCCSTLSQFLVRVLQLSHGEAASRVRAAARPWAPPLHARRETGTGAAAAGRVATRRSPLDREGGDCGTGHAQTVPTRPRPGRNRASRRAAHRPCAILNPADLRRFAHAVVNAADPDGPEPVDDQSQQDRRYMELKQRRDGMWHLQGRLTNILGSQLNAILDPLAKPRNSSIDDPDGTTTTIPDPRPSMQRLHDALEEACAKLLKTADLPSVGGIPASVIVTITLEDLLAKAGLAETADGTQLNFDQLCRITDEADIWPLILNPHGVPLALGRSQRLASRRPNTGVDRPGRRLLLPRLHPPPAMVRPPPHCGLDPGRPHRPEQPHLALPLPPHPLPPKRLDLPHQP